MHIVNGRTEALPAARLEFESMTTNMTE